MAAESLDIIVKMKDLASKQAKALGTNLKVVAKESSASFAGLYKSLFNIPNALAAVSASVAAQKLVEGIALASDLEAIENGFKNLTREAGGAKAVLEALQRGTRGTVSDFKLMEIANKAMLYGVGNSADEFEKLATISRRMGRAVGRDATEAFADLTIGMGRESRLILDNLGIIVDAEEAYKKYARQLGTTAEKLSDVQKRTAFNAAVFDATSRAAKRLGYDAWTLADSWGKFVTTLRNLRDDVLRSLIPMMQGLADAISDGIKKNKPEIYEFIASLLEGFGGVADVASQLASMVEGIVTKAQTALRYLKEAMPGGSTGSALKAILLEKERMAEVVGMQQALNVALEQYEALLVSNAPQHEINKALEYIVEVQHRLELATKAANEPMREQAAKISLVGDAARSAARALRDAANTISSRRVGGGAPLLPDIKQVTSFFAKQSRSVAQYREMLANDERNAMRSAEAQMETPEYRRLMEEASERYREDLLKENEIRHEATIKARELNQELREQYQLSAGVSAEVRKMGVEAKSLGAIGASVVRDVGEGIADSMVDPLWDFISVTKDAGEAFTELGKSILETLGKIVLQETLTMGVKAAFSGIGGLFSSSATDTANSINLAGWAGDGGVFPGHLQRVKGHFARGDVARERGLYELRERGQDEAVIPLVGNRYVPVKMMSTDPQGGSSKQIVNNFSFTFQGDSKQFARQLRENAEAVASIVAEKQNSSMRFREAMAA